MKILWLTNIPSPYRVDFFNELGKYCQLTVLFEREASAERDESWKQFDTKNFEAVFLKGWKIGVAEAFCPSVKQYLIMDMYDHIVVTNFSDLTGMYAIRYMKKKHIPYEIESDGAFADSGKGLKEKVKKYFLSGAERYFSTAEEHDKYYLTYGAIKEKIVRYPFSSIHTDDILSNPITKSEKIELKKKLGVNEDSIVLAVGQFIPRKGFDILIKSMAQLPRDMGCYIVGGKAPKEYIDLVNQYNLKNVHFIDFMKKDVLKAYYRIADVFVHPTREDIWGLVINEAMSQGVPIISTNRCIAALELIKDGENGYIFSVGDVEMLSEKIKIIVNDASLRRKMEEQTLRAIKKYTIEEMAKRHMEIFTQCKS